MTDIIVTGLTIAGTLLAVVCGTMGAFIVGAYIMKKHDLP